MKDNNKKPKLDEYTIISTDYLTKTPATIINSGKYTVTINGTIYSDGTTSGFDVKFSDLHEQLKIFEQEKEEDENLRENHPVLQEAYEHYQLIKKLVENNKSDKTFEHRYKGFSEK